MANVSETFRTNDFAPLPNTTEPTNVALICRWTYMCSNLNIHPNGSGYLEIARSFEELPVLRRIRS